MLAILYVIARSVATWQSPGTDTLLKKAVVFPLIAHFARNDIVLCTEEKNKQKAPKNRCFNFYIRFSKKSEF